MSGDLKNPSKSIPKGTLSGLALTFVTYALVVIAMAASITRNSFYNNVNIIQEVSQFPSCRISEELTSRVIRPTCPAWLSFWVNLLLLSSLP